MSDALDFAINASMGDLLSDLTDWTTELDAVASPTDANDRADWTVTESGVTSAGSGVRLPGYSLWFDASQLVGLSDGQSMSSWPDLSGNGHNMSQSTPASQPTYYSSTVAHLINGHPAVEVVGAQLMVSSAFTALGHPMTLAGTVFLNNISGSAWLWGDATNRPLVGTTGAQGYSTLTTAGTSVFVNNTVPISFVMVCNGTNTNVLVANGSFGAGAPPTTAINVGWTTAQIGLSTNLSSPGRIGELLAYPFQLTLAQAVSLRLYLVNKWGTT